MFSLITLGIISIVGNSLAVHVFRRKGRNITVPEVLLLNIAVSDLFLAGASHPATIIAAFSHRWIFGEIGMDIMIAFNQIWSYLNNFLTETLLKT